MKKYKFILLCIICLFLSLIISQTIAKASDKGFEFSECKNSKFIKEESLKDCVSKIVYRDWEKTLNEVDNINPDYCVYKENVEIEQICKAVVTEKIGNDLKDIIFNAFRKIDKKKYEKYPKLNKQNCLLYIKEPYPLNECLFYAAAKYKDIEACEEMVDSYRFAKIYNKPISFRKACMFHINYNINLTFFVYLVFIIFVLVLGGLLIYKFRFKLPLWIKSMLVSLGISIFLIFIITVPAEFISSMDWTMRSTFFENIYDWTTENNNSAIGLILRVLTFLLLPLAYLGLILSSFLTITAENKDKMELISSFFIDFVSPLLTGTILLKIIANWWTKSIQSVWKKIVKLILIYLCLMSLFILIILLLGGPYS